MKTKDPVNQYVADQFVELGPEELGLMNSSGWRDDPRRLVITLSRYKFVAKMLKGLDKVAEIGCGDGFGARIVRQEVRNLTITDYDPVFIDQLQGSSILNGRLRQRRTTSLQHHSRKRLTRSIL